MATKPTATIHTLARPFGQLLKHWRQTRRLSQLGLAADADISARHLCFLETGRAAPSREMVQLLAQTLDLPLAEQNAMFVAAGYAPPFTERDPTGAFDTAMQPVRQALDFILGQQEPYPAIVIDGHWNVRLRNEASRRVFGPFRKAYGMDGPLADNAMHVVFHPKGLRPFIENWHEFAGQMIQILHRDVAQGSAAAAALLDQIVAYPGLPRTWRTQAAPTSPVLAMKLRKDGHQMAFFSTFTTLAMPGDAAVQKLKIECFFPADDRTAATCRNLARAAT